MKILSKVLNRLMIISVFAIVITMIISVCYFDGHLLQYFLYEVSIFLMARYSKDMVDAELLERKIIEEIWKPKEKELSRSKNDENTK